MLTLCKAEEGCDAVAALTNAVAVLTDEVAALIDAVATPPDDNAADGNTGSAVSLVMNVSIIRIRKYPGIVL